MKEKLLFLAFASFGALGCPASETQAPPDFLHAIRLVESGDRYDTPPGRGGEVGPYQFRSLVWRRYTTAPLAAASTPLADKVASRHYCWIARSLRRRGVEASAWNVAAAWNSGLRSVLSGRIPSSTRDYADRVVNLIGCCAGDRREEPVRIASR